MARAKAFAGYHVYKCGWELYVNEKIQCEREPNNTHDKYSVKIVKSKYTTVGHVPIAYSKYVTLVLLNGGFLGVTVKGKPCNPRNNGQDVPCSVFSERSEGGFFSSAMYF